MVAINFEGYKSNKMIYQKNSSFIDFEDVNFENNISFTFHIDDENEKAVVIIGLETGSLEDEKLPFYIDVEVEGYFTYSAEEDETDAGFENFIRYNCAAILYPYLRSIISTLTNTANDFPPYNLPTINIVKAIQQSDEDN